MAQKFRLIQRRNLGKDAATAPKKMYAQAVNNGYVTFDELCTEISELCSLTSADVKAVLDRMNYSLDKNLRAGRIVQFGEIGNFRLGVGSSGSVTEDEFASTQIRTPKIIFSPGSKLRATRSATTFEKVTPQVVAQPVECDKEHVI